MSVTFMLTIYHSFLSFIIVPFPGHVISYRAYIFILYFSISFTHSFIHCSSSVKCAYLSSLYPHIINPFPLHRLIPPSLTVLWSQFRFHNSYMFLRWQAVGLSPDPRPPTPRAGWPSYTPRHRVPILVACYNLHGLQWESSLPWSPHGESYFNTRVQITFLVLFTIQKIMLRQHISLCACPGIGEYTIHQIFKISNTGVCYKSCWISSSLIKIGALKAYFI